MTLQDVIDDMDELVEAMEDASVFQVKSWLEVLKAEAERRKWEQGYQELKADKEEGR